MEEENQLRKLSSDLHMCDIVHVNVHTSTKNKCKNQSLMFGNMAGGIAQHLANIHKALLHSASSIKTTLVMTQTYNRNRKQNSHHH